MSPTHSASSHHPSTIQPPPLPRLPNLPPFLHPSPIQPPPLRLPPMLPPSAMTHLHKFRLNDLRRNFQISSDCCFQIFIFETLCRREVQAQGTASELESGLGR